jgi:hypothetical protein
VRDARSQGRQERGAGRDRDLARRSRPLIEPALRIAAAILVDTLAFLVWNLSTRSPLQLLRDVAAGVRRPATLLRGIVSFAVGLLLLLGSLSILIPLLLPRHALVVLAIWSAVTGLLVEQLIGAGLYGRRPTGTKP